MLRHILRQEWRALAADRSLLLISLTTALLVGYGIYNGTSWVRFQRSTLDSVQAEYSGRVQSLKAELRKIEEGSAKARGFQDPRSAAAIGNGSAAPYMAMPPAPLAAFSVGQSDVYPYYFKAGLGSRQTLLTSDEIENPLHLLSGRFDLAFVVIYLYPLLILALGYNIVSGEREQGTLALTLSQPVSLRALIARKIAFRAGFLLVLLSVLAVVAAFFTGVNLLQSGSAERLALWILVVAAYGAFWFSLAIAVNLLGKSSATNALNLAGIWLLLVLVIPSILNIAAASFFPIPSRVEMIEAVREATREVSQNTGAVLAQYFEDHPDLAPPGARANSLDSSSALYAVQMKVEKATEPVIAHFEAQARNQQRIVDSFRFLSPAVLVQQSLNDISGTGLSRYRDFLSQVTGFLSQWQSLFFRQIFQRATLRSDQIDSLPAFVYKDEPFGAVLTRVAIDMAGLLIAAGILLFLASRGLRRFSVAA